MNTSSFFFDKVSLIALDDLELALQTRQVSTAIVFLNVRIKAITSGLELSDFKAETLGSCVHILFFKEVSVALVPVSRVGYGGPQF